jgi:hypothetical protein
MLEYQRVVFKDRLDTRCLLRDPSVRNLSVVVAAGVLALIGWSVLATSSSSVATETFGAETPAILPNVTITVDKIVTSGFSQPVQVTHAGDSFFPEYPWYLPFVCRNW